MKNQRIKTVVKIGLILLILLTSGTVSAGNLAIPKTFTNGETADASEVNRNFEEIATQVNDNNNRISHLQKKTLSFPARSLTIPVGSQTVILAGNRGLDWQRPTGLIFETPKTASLIIAKPDDFGSGDVTFRIAFTPRALDTGTVDFFIWTGSTGSGKILNFLDSDAISSVPLNIDGTFIDFNIARFYEQSFTIPEDKLNEDWWFFSIERAASGTFGGAVSVMSVALQYNTQPLLP